jgi:hypothetical protein
MQLADQLIDKIVGELPRKHFGSEELANVLRELVRVLVEHVEAPLQSIEVFP